LKRNTRKTLNIAADRAAHALHVLIADGKIAARDVTDALKRREAMIRELRDRLVALEQGAVSAMKATGKKVRKAKRRMTAARLAALRLNGKYMGHVRRLSKAQKATVKKIRETKGVRAGIAAAKRMEK
jgi:hypothetical protein